MSSQIYIASTNVAGDAARHLYLIYDPNSDQDDNAATGNGVEIIRGGPTNSIGTLNWWANGAIFGGFQNIIVEPGRLEIDSDNKFDGDSMSDRRAEQIEFIGSADTTWTSMKSYALSWGNLDANGIIYTNFDYVAAGPNSNSVISTVLNIHGIDFRDNLPTGSSDSEFPGHMALLDGSGDSAFTAFVNEGVNIQNVTDFYKRGGNDTITLEDRPDLGRHGQARLIFDSVVGGDTHFTTVRLESIASSEASVQYGDTIRLFDGPITVVDYEVQVDDFVSLGLADNLAFEFDDAVFRLGDDAANYFDASDQSKSALLDGRNGNDTLLGSSQDDTISGGAGNDVLQGGTGNDVFTGFATELNGDTIIDLQVGDKIIVGGFYNSQNYVHPDRVIVSYDTIKLNPEGYRVDTVINADLPHATRLDVSKTPGVANSVTLEVVDDSDVLGYGLTSSGLSSAHLVRYRSDFSAVDEGPVNVDLGDAASSNLTAHNGYLYKLGTHYNYITYFHLTKIDPVAHATVSSKIIEPSVGGTGTTAVHSLAVDANGTFYASATPQYGAYTFLIKFNENSTKTETVGRAYASTMDFSPDGTLYGWQNSLDGGQLVTINTATAATTPIGSLHNINMFSISFTQDGYLLGRSGNRFYTIDPETGVPTQVPNIGGGSVWFEATGNLYPDGTPSTGAPGDDVVSGNPGDDTLTGNPDDDTLTGSPGEDTITGSPGDDTIVAGNGGGGGPGGGSGGGGSNGGGSSGGGSTGVTTPPPPPTIPTTTTQIGSGPTSVVASTPTTIGVAAQGPGPTSDPTTASSNLTNALNSAGGGSTGTAPHSAATKWLATVTPGTTVDVQTLSLTSTSGTAPGEPIVITGAESGGANQEAYAINVSQLPSGTTVHLNNIEFISITGSASFGGGAGSSYVVADDAAQRIVLGEDDDTISGGGGDDYVGSLDGNDLLYGNQGTDTLGGGLDNDTLYGGQQDDLAYGNQGSDVLYGNFQNDTLYGGQDSDTLYGGQNEDVVYGNYGDDTLNGNLGLDTLYGGQGNDRLNGGAHNDVLVGNLGDDTLAGGSGDDTLQGSDGADLFVIETDGGADIITDFDAASGDRIWIQSNINGTGIEDGAGILRTVRADDSANAVLDFGNGTQVTLIGVLPSDLSAQDFTFG